MNIQKITGTANHISENINQIMEARTVCFLHKAIIPKIRARIKQRIHNGRQNIHKNIPIIVILVRHQMRHKKLQTKAKTKLAIASQFHQFLFSSIL